jgi:leucyl aminopeptidase
MDFKTQVAGAGGLAAVASDALLVVIAGDAVPQGLDKALADVLSAAVEQGDVALKAGQAFYAHRVAGVKAPRVCFAAAGDGAAKGFRKALAAGLGALKGGGAKSVAVALVGSAEAGAAHGEALVAAATDAVYVYRATKPSAPAASKLASVSFVVAKAQQAAVNAGLQVGEAVAAGVELARECANRPGNHCTPSHLASWPSRRGSSPRSTA